MWIPDSMSHRSRTHFALWVTVAFAVLATQNKHLCMGNVVHSDPVEISETTPGTTQSTTESTTTLNTNNADVAASETQNTVDANSERNLESNSESDSDTNVASGVEQQAQVFENNAISANPTLEHEVIGDALTSLAAQTSGTGTATGSSSSSNAISGGDTEVAVSNRPTQYDLTSEDDVLLQALQNLENYTTIEDLVTSGTLYKNGRIASLSDLEARYNRSTGRVYINNMENFPQPDECAPRHTTIRLNISNVDASVIVYPRCIQELRCGGCCRMPDVTCSPTYTEQRLYKLMLLRPIVRQNQVDLDFDSYHTVRVDRHLLCKCQCTLTPEHCGADKHLNRQKCRCECNDRPRCRIPSRFNPDTCACECPSHQQETCATPLDPRTGCRCGRRFMSADGGSNGNGTTRHAAQNAILVSSFESEDEATVPTTPTTTTTLQPTTRDPCASFNCPPNHTPVRVRTFCLCRMNSIGSAGGRRGRPHRGNARDRSRYRGRPTRT